MRWWKVIANDSVLRSSTVDTTSAEALPELGIAQLPSRFNTACKHAGSVRRRPLTCSRAARRPPDSTGTANIEPQTCGAPPCRNQCFRCDESKAAKKESKWSPAEQVRVVQLAGISYGV